MAFYKTDEQLEALVRDYFRRIGLEHQIRPDLMTVLVKTKHIDKRFNYARMDESELPEVEAEWDSVKVCVRMRESVFVAMQRNESRGRMTVAHELAHYLLGHKGFLNRKPGIRAHDIPVASIRQEESEATAQFPKPDDVFAAQKTYQLLGQSIAKTEGKFDEAWGNEILPALKEEYGRHRGELLAILQRAGIEARSGASWVVEKALASMLLFYAVANRVKEIRDMVWCIFPFCFKRPTPA